MFSLLLRGKPYANNQRNRKRREFRPWIDQLENRFVPTSLAVNFDIGGVSTTVFDGGAGDSDGLVNNRIEVDSLTIGNAGVGQYLIDSVTVRGNSPGTPSISFENAGGNSIVNLTASPATSVKITVSEDGFLVPSSPPSIVATSNSTGLIGVGNGAVHAAYKAYVDSENLLFAE